MKHLLVYRGPEKLHVHGKCRLYSLIKWAIPAKERFTCQELCGWKHARHTCGMDNGLGRGYWYCPGSHVYKNVPVYHIGSLMHSIHLNCLSSKEMLIKGGFNLRSWWKKTYLYTKRLNKESRHKAIKSNSTVSFSTGQTHRKVYPY